jgi:hypothetical protein
VVGGVGVWAGGGVTSAETVVLRVPVPWRRAPWVMPISAVERAAAARLRAAALDVEAAPGGAAFGPGSARFGAGLGADAVGGSE